MDLKIFTLLSLFPLLALGQQNSNKYWHYTKPKDYIAYKTTLPITIDGKADEPSWQSAKWTDDFVDIEGDKKTTPGLRTRVKILWDDNYFYFFAEMEEPDIWGNITERDAVIFHNNDFEIFLKPYTEYPQYGEFEINALGSVWDLLLINAYRENGPVINNWDIKGLKTAVHINGTLNDPSDKDEGWAVEFAIPGKALQELKFKSERENTPSLWRINFSRVEWQHSIINGHYSRKKDEKGKLLSENNWVWSPQGVIDMHQPEFWGYVKFSDKKPGTDKFSPDPDEGIIQALFHLYRQEKRYFNTNGNYTKDVKILEPLKFSFNGKEIEPGIVQTNFGYEIVFDLPTKGMRYIINEKGIINKIKY
jgi:hypothetical protein